MENPELVQVLTKVHQRMPFDEWDLTEEEYNILE